MKYFSLVLLFLGWCMVTIFAAITIVGIILLIDNTDWFKFPNKIIEKF